MTFLVRKSPSRRHPIESSGVKTARRPPSLSTRSGHSVVNVNMKNVNTASTRWEEVCVV